MVIEYLIAASDGREIVSGQFNSNNRVQQSRFARRAEQAWKDGHAVITQAVARWQSENGLVADGVVGVKTARAMGIG